MFTTSSDITNNIQPSNEWQSSSIETNKRNIPFPEVNTSLELTLEKARAKLIKLKAEDNVLVSSLNQKISVLESIISQQAERIRQNSIEIENVIALYQNEIEKRQDVLNKLLIAQDNIKKGVENSNHVAKFLILLQADRTILSESYQEAGKILRKKKINYGQTIRHLHNIIKKLDIELAAEKKLRCELTNNWYDKDNTTTEYINCLRQQLGKREDFLKTLKLEKENFSSNNKKLKDSICILLDLSNQKHQKIDAEQTYYKNLFDIVCQKNDCLRKENSAIKCQNQSLKINNENFRVSSEKELNDSKIAQDEAEKKIDVLNTEKITLLKDKENLIEEIKMYKTLIEENKKIQAIVNETLKNTESSSNIKLADIIFLHDKERSNYAKETGNLQYDLTKKSNEIKAMSAELELFKKSIREHKEKLKNLEYKLEDSNEAVFLFNQYIRKNHSEMDELSKQLKQSEQKCQHQLDKIEKLEQNLEKVQTSLKKIKFSENTKKKRKTATPIGNNENFRITRSRASKNQNNDASSSAKF